MRLPTVMNYSLFSSTWCCQHSLKGVLWFSCLCYEVCLFCCLYVIRELWVYVFSRYTLGKCSWVRCLHWCLYSYVCDDRGSCLWWECRMFVMSMVYVCDESVACLWWVWSRFVMCCMLATSMFYVCDVPYVCYEYVLCLWCWCHILKGIASIRDDCVMYLSCERKQERLLMSAMRSGRVMKSEIETASVRRVWMGRHNRYSAFIVRTPWLWALVHTDYCASCANFAGRTHITFYNLTRLHINSYFIYLLVILWAIYWGLRSIF